MAIHKARDNSVKSILAEHELFAAFLRNFIPVGILQNISPSDIEDVSERLLPLVSEQKDGYTIKRINLKNKTPLFVITIVEHESKVNFRAPFKMLLYTALILDAYEKEVNKESKGKSKVTLTKDFKYPPVLPIVFYDGEDEWTAEMNFLHRTEMNDVFEKYIPKFEYELVDLKKYSFSDLVAFGDAVSLFMMIDKLKTPEAFAELNQLPKAQIARLETMNIPSHLKEVLIRVITVLLEKINVPKNGINNLIDKIDERGVSEMIEAGVIDVQKMRREALAKARADVFEEVRADVFEEVRAEVFEEVRAEVGRKLTDTQKYLLSAIKLLLDQGYTISEISTKMNMPEQGILELLPELA